MTNFFALLELPESLSLDPEAVENSWREKSRALSDAADFGDGASESGPALDHPDLNQARSTLSDPALRLAHWLALRAPGAPADRSIDPSLMDLFAAISPVLGKTDEVLARHRHATTALAKAMLTREAIEAQLQVQGLLAQIQPLRHTITDQLDSIERAGASGDYQPASRALGQLRFLKRWEEQCRERLLSLIAC
jgi:hypothetical protein